MKIMLGFPVACLLLSMGSQQLHAKKMSFVLQGENCKLGGTPLKEYGLNSKLQCIMKCLNSELCRSVNIKVKSESLLACQLMKENKFTSPDGIVDEKNWSYYEGLREHAYADTVSERILDVTDTDVSATDAPKITIVKQVVNKVIPLKKDEGNI